MWCRIRKITIQTDNGSELSGTAKTGNRPDIGLAGQKGFVYEVENILKSDHEIIPPACRTPMRTLSPLTH